MTVRRDFPIGLQLSNAGALLASFALHLVASGAARDEPPRETKEPPVVTAGAPADPEHAPFHASLTLNGTYGVKGDLKDTSGSVATSRLGAGLDFSVPAGGQGDRLSFGFGSEAAIYDFTDAGAFAPGFTKPWDTILQHSLSATYLMHIDERWTAFASVGIASIGEAGAKFGDTLEYRGAIGASYSFSEKFTLGFGVAANSVLEDDANIIPIIILNYAISDRWSVRTGGGLSQGLGVSLNFKQSDTFDYALQLGGRDDNFRLDSDGANPRGVGRDRSFGVILRANWHIDQQATISALIGTTIYQRLVFDDPNGNRLNALEVDPAPFIGLSLNFGF